MIIIPIVIMLASAAFGAPTALGEDLAHELADNPETMGAYVRAYFADTPILADIAWCESRMRHLDKHGNLMRGEIDEDDIGVMQINTRYHGEDSKELGYDIYGLAGNLAYAKYLYEKQGSKPWNSSKPCWGKIAANR